MMSKKMIKVISIIMAALMLLSVFAVVLQVIAVDEAAAAEAFVNPATGDSDSDYLIPAGIAVAAILAVVICLVLPKMKKKDEQPVTKKVSDASDKAQKNKKPPSKPPITKTKE